jgi:hypothetical protein
MNATCHPDRPLAARGYCRPCYNDHITRRHHQRNGRNYQHNDQTRLEAAIARWGTPHKAAEQTGLPFWDLWGAWLRLEAAVGNPDPAVEAERLAGLAACGTYAAYKRHLRNRERPDMECRKAHAIETQNRRRRTLEAS